MASRQPRLSQRALAEASTGGAAVWAKVLELAKPPGTINLGQGFPDFAGSASATAGAIDALQQGQHDQYTPVPGSERIRAAISGLYRRLYPDIPRAPGGGSRALDVATEVCVTTSGTEALYCAVLGLVDPGDEVVFFEPFFPWYLPCIRMAGGVPKPVTLCAPDFDLLSVEAELRAAFSPRTRLCIFNTPHNPTGHCASAAELALLARLCQEHDVVCVADEVYESAVYPGQAEHRRLCEVGGMWERTLTVGSASKLLSLTGWRVGWCVGPAELVKAVATLHAYTSFCAPSPLQAGVAAALDAEPAGPQPPFDGRAALMAANWEVLATALRTSGVGVCPAQGGYFLVADVSATGMGDMEYCRWLSAEHGVAAVPASVFFCSAAPPGALVRFAVCKERETIAAAAARLEKATVARARAHLASAATRKRPAEGEP